MAPRIVDSGPIEILLVEDNPGDVRLTQEVLKDGRIANTLHTVGDGVAALDFLRRRGDYACAGHIDLVLLDLNLPKKDGRDVLAEMRDDPDLHNTPVVVLTMSAAESDVRSAYELNANAYIVKPVDLGQFEATVRSIEDFWLTIVRLPEGGD